MKSFSLLFLMCLAMLAGKAQNQPEQNCINGIPVCLPTYTQPNTYIGPGTVVELDADNQGCLGSGEKNCVWYIIQVSVSGQLSFNITPNNLANDYDWAVWDITANGCQDIYNDGQPIACNYSGTPGVTGLTPTLPLPGGGQFSPSITVTAGQTLAFNVSNFSETQQSGYLLDFSSSTASVYDTVGPKFLSVYVPCAYTSDSVDLKMNEPVKCSSVQADGSNFYIRTAAGGILPGGIGILSATPLNCISATALTRDIRIRFTSVLPPGTYRLFPKIGTNNTAIADGCGNTVNTLSPPRDSIPFTMVSPIPPEVVYVEPPSCISAKIGWDRKVQCSTIAPNGSDFTITGPAPVKIVRVDKSKCDNLGLTDTLTLYFEESVALPGVYSLGFKTGTDGDGILDTCGKEAVVPFNFIVSDEGVTATASPSVLCEPGYTDLSAVPLNPPSNYIPVCGTAQGPFVGTNTVNAIIGTGTTTTNGSPAYTPFNGFYNNARTQMIYRAADLLAGGLLPGRIDQLALDIATKGSSIPYSGFTIKMSCTALNDLSGGFVAGVPIVYGPVSYNTTVGLNNFPLNTVHEWDGTQNILVELCFSNTTFTGYDQVRYTTNANTTNAVLHRYQDSGPAGCAFTTATGFGGTSSALPNIRMRATTPPPGGYFLLWQPGTGVFDSTAFNTRAYVEKDKNFIVQIKDTFQCFRRDTVRVIIPPRFPEADPNNDTSICIGGAARLMVTGGQTFNWFPATGLSCTDCPNPTASPNVTTTYFVSIADQYGCADTLTNTVVVNPLPVVRASADTLINWGSSAQLYVFSPGADYFLWTPVTGLNNATSPAPQAAPLETTEYRVEVIDSNYCISYDTVVVSVNKNSPMFVPNAFTPNGDGVNDIFQVANIAFNKLVELRVFNRWGQQVAYTTDNRQGWDGTLSGTLQDPGVYQYIIRVAVADGTLRVFKGDVTLIR
jgi:gliding motility-associated-like protein